METLNSESDSDNPSSKTLNNSKYLDLKNDLRIELLMEEFWNLLKEWAIKFTPISTFKNWENKLKLRLHNFPIGQELILSIDSEEMLDFSSTVFDYLKLLFKYFKPFSDLKIKINKKILAWRTHKNGMMRTILDLPLHKCDYFRVKKIVEHKLHQDDEHGIDFSGMAPENRKICISAIYNNKKRPNNNPNNNPKSHTKNPNFSNPNNPSYRGGAKNVKRFKKEKKTYR